MTSPVAQSRTAPDIPPFLNARLKLAADEDTVKIQQEVGLVCERHHETVSSDIEKKYRITTIRLCAGSADLYEGRFTRMAEAKSDACHWTDALTVCISIASKSII